MFGERVIVLKRLERKSLRKEIFMMSFIALCMAAVFYFAASYTSSYMLDNYWNTKEHIKNLENTKAKELQDYVTNHKLSINDMEQVDDWAYNNDAIFIKMFVNNNLVYDTLYGLIADDGMAIPEQINDIKNLKFYTIKFSDGEAKTIFTGVDDYDIYVFMDYVVLIISFIVFLIILTIGISKKVKYVSEIADDLHEIVFSLEHPVRIKGNDELTYVAESINYLRESIIEKIESEKLAYKSNMKLITSLSHDIRTPLTSIIAYLELVSTDDKIDNENRKNVNISLDRAYRLKEMTDQLFEHFLLDSEDYKAALEKVNGNELIVQFVEEYLYDLEIKGIKIIRSIHDVKSILNINIALVGRLFDNIYSNINKYADLSKPIYVEYGISDDYLFVSFKNHKAKEIDKKNSTNIGLKNCKSIMEIHKGKIEIKNLEETFEVRVFLPIKAK